MAGWRVRGPSWRVETSTSEVQACHLPKRKRPPPEVGRPRSSVNVWAFADGRRELGRWKWPPPGLDVPGSEARGG